jgi:RHS repeat-associated protein
VLGTRQSATESTSWASFPGGDPHKIPIDPNGNLATKTEGTDSWVYTWNAENQLVKVEKNGAEVARFAYDPAGRRVEKVAVGVTTSYTYDGGAILREMRGSTTLNYVHGSRIDEPLAVDNGAGLSFFHADVLGSVVKVTSMAGAVTLAHEYDAWGNVEAGVTEPGYAFTGREWDPETGLHYYRARYYDPKIARFVSEDPLGQDQVDHLYSYVEDDPLNSRDPSGLLGARCVGCSRSQKRQVWPIAKTFCDNVAGSPRCQMALRQMMPMDIVRCVEKRCREPIPLRCGRPCGPDWTEAGRTQGGQCLQTDRPDMEIIIRDPAFSSNSGLAETFGHEFMHLCGLGPDPGGRGSGNRDYAMRAESADMVGKMCAVRP